MEIETILIVAGTSVIAGTIGYLLKISDLSKNSGIETPADAAEIEKSQRRSGKYGEKILPKKPQYTIAETQQAPENDLKTHLDFEAVHYQEFGLLNKLKDQRSTFNKPIVIIGGIAIWGLPALFLGLIFVSEIKNSVAQYFGYCAWLVAWLAGVYSFIIRKRT
jgi:hypothetical protein